jgi:glycosyltransferase involved in cell wall biosynthesis
VRVEEQEFASVDGLLAPSPFVAQTLEAGGIQRDRILRHHYGADPVPGASAEHPENQDREPLRVCFVGSVEPRKGLHFALDAWLASGAAASGHLTVVGRLMEGYADLLRGRLAHPSVEVLGFSDRPVTTMIDSHALVLPSIEEGSALVTYEAQAAGCALLVSEASGARCTHGEHGLVHPVGDVSALASHIRRLDHDRALLRQLRRGALTHSRTLTWCEAGRCLLECYQKVIEGPACSRASANASDLGLRIAPENGTFLPPRTELRR